MLWGGVRVCSWTIAFLIQERKESKTEIIMMSKQIILKKIIKTKIKGKPGMACRRRFCGRARAGVSTRSRQRRSEHELCNFARGFERCFRLVVVYNICDARHIGGRI